MADFCMFFVDFVKSKKRESQTLMKMGGLCKIDNMVLGVYSHLKPKRKKIVRDLSTCFFNFRKTLSTTFRSLYSINVCLTSSMCLLIIW